MGLGNGNPNYGNKGSNFNFELRNLQLLGQIAAAIPSPPAGLATEGTLISVLNAIVASDQDIEVLLVRDQAPGNGDPVLKQVTNYQTGVPVITYENVDGTTYVPTPNPPNYVYLDPSAVLNLMLAELLAQGISLDSIVTSTGLSATEVTQLLVDANLTLLNTKLNTLGQKASAASAPVVLSTEQEVILDGIAADLALIYTNLQLNTVATQNMLISLATEATLLNVETVLDAIEVLITTTNSLLTTIDTVLDNILLDTTAILADTTTLATPSTGLAVTTLRVTAAGAASVTAGKRRVSFLNAGNNDATVDGVTIKRGEFVSYNAGDLRDTLEAITYNALTSELLITSIG